MISNTGNGITTLAVPWFVLATTGSTAQTGIVGAAFALSPIVAGILGGPLVDRAGFKRASIIADILSGITVALIPTLYLLDLLNFGLLLALIFLGAAMDVPGRTARRSLVPRLSRMAGMSLERSNSIFTLSGNISADLLGPIAAGALITVLGSAQVLFVDAATFAISILLVWFFIRLPASENVSDETAETDNTVDNGYIAEIKEGFQFLIHDAVLSKILPIAIFTNFIGSALGALVIIVYARETFGGAGALGLLFASFGLGAAVGTILYGIVGERFPRYWSFVAMAAGGAISLWLLPVVPVLGINMAVIFIFGFAVGPANALVGVIVMSRVPERLLGRVSGAMATGFSIAAPLGPLVAGFALVRIDVTTLMYIFAAALSIVPLVSIFVPRFRNSAAAFDE